MMRKQLLTLKNLAERDQRRRSTKDEPATWPA